MLPRRLGIVMCILSSDRQVQNMTASNVAANQPVVSNIFSDLPLQISLDLQLLERVIELIPGGGSAWLSDGG